MARDQCDVNRNEVSPASTAQFGQAYHKNVECGLKTVQPPVLRSEQTTMNLDL